MYKKSTQKQYTKTILKNNTQKQYTKTLYKNNTHDKNLFGIK